MDTFVEVAYGIFLSWKLMNSASMVGVDDSFDGNRPGFTSLRLERGQVSK